MSQILIIASPLTVMLFVASITPGPNNLMLMLAGTRFGFAQTVPHLLGVTGGTGLVLCITCRGAGFVDAGPPACGRLHDRRVCAISALDGDAADRTRRPRRRSRQSGGSGP